MPLSAWIMLIFGIVVLYGGLIYCVSKTRRHEKNNQQTVLEKNKD